jgi:iron complex outermembrane recepter protein
MRFKHAFACTIIGFVLSVLPSAGAQPGSAPSSLGGNIAGRVKNTVTGQYLNNARVAVAGTDIVVFTDETGSFRIAGAPSGPVELVVSFTGLDAKRAPVTVRGGGTVEQDFELSSAARYGPDTSVVQLDSFVVTADLDTNAQSIAVNEQRHAPNVKNVVSTDSFGSVLGNSVGEFLKFIPGVTVGYSGNEITEFSVRGIGGAMTSVTQDGAPMVFGSYSTMSRGFNPYTSDLNDAARVEVAKVPTPSIPADSIGGSINFVSKSAFERDRPLLRVNLSVIGNSKDITWKKTPTSLGDRENHKTLPSLGFDYTLPVNKNFGLVVTGLSFPKASNYSDFRTGWSGAGTSTGATLANPYLRTLLELEGPRLFTKENLSVKADWRATRNSVLSFSYKWSRNKTLIGAQNRQADAGTVGTPVPATGQPLAFGPDFTRGATGRGTVNLTSLFQEFNGGTTSPTLTWRHDDGRWKIDALLSQSVSMMEKDNPGGPFSSIVATLRNPARVTFSQAGHDRRPSLEVFENNNARVDLNDISQYRLASGQEIFYRREAETRNADLKVKRRLEALPFPSSIEAGGTYTWRDYDQTQWVRALTWNGPDGNPATADPIDAYRMQVYHNQTRFSGGGDTPWLSPDRLWTAWKQNPVLFSQTPAQFVAEENGRIQNSRYIEEAVTAFYLQGEARLLANRLRVLGGVRHERTVTEGQGPLVDPDAVWVRNADGSFARNAQGARIRKPEAGAVNSIEQLRLTSRERAYPGKRSYDGFYPSLHTTYEFSDALVARGAYARTFGRPDYDNIVPGATIQEADLGASGGGPSTVQGTITVRNTGLKPWTADNYDLTLEYYSKSGGIVSGGIFLKEIRDFFGDQQRLATQADLDSLGLDSRYLGWELNSTFNAGDARITGAELNVRQSLSPLGAWGRHVTVFANGTRLFLKGNQQASFTTFIPKSANWGISGSHRRASLGLKWNYRGLDRRVPLVAFGSDGFRYFKSRTSLDLDAAYVLSRRLTLALTITNVTNVPAVIWLEYGSQTPAYARHAVVFDAGAQYSLGLKATF